MIQLEEIREREQTEQSSAALETVPRQQAASETVPTSPMMPEAPALTSGVNASTEAITEPRRSSRLHAPPKSMTTNCCCCYTTTNLLHTKKL
jgi:hypothetical protein